jgi:hypothetical protein
MAESITNVYNESRTVVKNLHGVTYIEPNADAIDTYKATTTGPTYRYQTSPDLSDYCIAVDLEVEVKARNATGTINLDSQVQQLSWQSSTDKDANVHFLRGTRIYTDEKKSTWVNSLTTNYTDTYYDDIKETSKATGEMFGIKSIDIQYDNFMVPQVSIEFCDVRGVSLFALEEFRHTLTDKNGISATADNSIEGSFFKCFFSFPYPKFTLRVKGFYGYMVSYELTCNDFRADFDSATGNFNVKTSFVGYAFSFLQDVMINMLVAAPYCDYLGKEYWDNKHFQLPSKDTTTSDMPTLAQIASVINQIKQKAQELKDKGEVNIDDAAAAANVDPNVLQKVSMDNTSVMADYDAVISSAADVKGKLEIAKGDAIVVDINGGEITDSCKGFAIVTQNSDAQTALDSIIGGNFSKLLSDWSVSKFKGDAPTFVTDTISEKGELGSTSSNPLLGNLRDKLKKEAFSKGSLWKDNSPKVYIFLANGLGEMILGNGVSADEAQQASEAIDRQAQKQAADLLLHFEPTVENFTRIVMAHFETFVYMLSQCARNILSNASQRTFATLGVTPDDLVDVVTTQTKNEKGDTTQDNTQIPPFPKVTKQIQQGEATKREDSWVGDGTYGDVSKWEEVTLVEQLLYSIEEMKKALEAAATETGDSGTTIPTCSVPIPLALYDFMMTGNDNPFGSMNIESADDVLGHLAVRAFGLIATQVTLRGEESYTKLGQLDAYNLISLFGNIGNTSFMTIVGNGRLTADSAIKSIVSNKSIVDKDSVPYDKLCELTKEKLYTIVKSDVDKKYGYLGFGHYKRYGKNFYGGLSMSPECVIPIKNWSFNTLTSTLNNQVTGIPQKYDMFVSSTDHIQIEGKEELSYTDDKANIFYVIDNGTAVDYMKQTVDQMASNANNVGDIDVDDIGDLWATAKFDGLDESLYGSDSIANIKKGKNGLVYNTDIQAIGQKADSAWNRLLQRAATPTQTAGQHYDTYNNTLLAEANSGTNDSTIASFVVKINNNVYASLFASPNYYYKKKTKEKNKPASYEWRDIVERAYMFIRKVYMVTSNNTVLEKSLKDFFSKNTAGVAYISKYELLFIEAVAWECRETLFRTRPLYHDCISGIKASDTIEAKKAHYANLFGGAVPRGTYVYTLASKFEEWANKTYSKIDATFKLHLKSLGDQLKYPNAKDGFLDIGGVLLAIKQNPMVVQSKGVVTQSIANMIVHRFFDEPSFNAAYLGIHTISKLDQEALVLVNNPYNPVLNDFIKEMWTPCALVMTTKFNRTLSEVNNSQKNHGPSAVQDYLRCYFTGMFDYLKKNASGTSDASSAQLGQVQDPEDLKVGVYNYLKLLYDKWLAGNLDEVQNNWTVNRMFDNGEENQYFYFIDSFYNKVGQQIYVNLETVGEEIINCQTTNGYTLCSFFSKIYSLNKFVFMCIQNFADFTKPELVNQMFTPIPYIACKDPENHPNFLVVYPYAGSAHLEMNDGNYPDDGFMLNDELDLPTMISCKPDDSYKIPAFGVSYASQYQSYFSNISVGMENPMTTEQSIKAKFQMIGINTNGKDDGTNTTILGQDLYTIYANNSYTCTLTMMGCAWVQPMMYFVLLNVPMFRGSYMIMKVTHHIEPGNMTTQITGVRMAKTSTRFVQTPLFGGSNSSMSEEDQIEEFENQNASISNDCKYAEFNPLGGDGEDFTAELGKEALSVAAPGCSNLKAGMTVLEALSRIAACEWSTNQSEEDKLNIYSVAQVLYNRRAIDKNYQVSIFRPKQFSDVSDSVKFNSDQINKIWKSYSPIIKQVWKGGASPFLVSKNSVEGQITLPNTQKVYQYINPNTEKKLLNESWYHGAAKQYTTKGYSTYQHQFYSSPSHPKGYTGSTVQTQSKGKKSKQRLLAEGLISSVQATLGATKEYASLKVKGTADDNGWAAMQIEGNNANNAVIFDVIQYAYNDWFDKLYWSLGNANANSNPTSILVHAVENPASNKTIAVCSDYTFSSLGKNGSSTNPKIAKLSTDKEFNANLKLSLIKRYKKLSITDGDKVKTDFKSVAGMEKAKIEEILELKKPSAEDSVTDCNTLAGYPNGGNMTLGSGGVLVQGKINDWDAGAACNGIIQHTLGSSSHHVCAKWVKYALAAGGLPYNSTDDGERPAKMIQSNLMNTWYGFNLIDHGTLTGAHSNIKYNSKITLQVGDVLLIDKFGDNPYGHICMYCGPQNGWYSDFKQPYDDVYHNKGQAWYLYRYNGHNCKINAAKDATWKLPKK